MVGVANSLKLALEHAKGLENKGLPKNLVNQLKDHLENAIGLQRDLARKHRALGEQPEENERNRVLAREETRVQALADTIDINKRQKVSIRRLPEEWQKLHSEEWQKHLVLVHALLQALMDKGIRPQPAHVRGWSKRSLQIGYGKSADALDQAIRADERVFSKPVS